MFSCIRTLYRVAIGSHLRLLVSQRAETLGARGKESSQLHLFVKAFKRRSSRDRMLLFVMAQRIHSGCSAMLLAWVMTPGQMTLPSEFLLPQKDGTRVRDEGLRL
jgi:hypothetical protein